jgi:hypothetical protein
MNSSHASSPGAKAGDMLVPLTRCQKAGWFSLVNVKIVTGLSAGS